MFVSLITQKHVSSSVGDGRKATEVCNRSTGRFQVSFSGGGNQAKRLNICSVSTEDQVRADYR